LRKIITYWEFLYSGILRFQFSATPLRKLQNVHILRCHQRGPDLSLLLQKIYSNLFQSCYHFANVIGSGIYTETCFISPCSVKEQVLLIVLIIVGNKICEAFFQILYILRIADSIFNVCSIEWSVFVVHFLLYKLISCLADQWIFQFFLQTKIHYYVHNNLPLINCPKTLDSNSHALILFHLRFILLSSYTHLVLKCCIFRPCFMIAK
jgi:hypothetical protein